jgi:hypothetical protein
MMRAALVLAMAGIGLGLVQSAAQEPLFRTHIDRVRVDVLVTANDRAVTGLSADDFRLLDNRVPQQLELLDRGGPVWLILVLDVSQSVDGEKLSRLREGCEAALAVYSVFPEQNREFDRRRIGTCSCRSPRRARSTIST